MIREIDISAIHPFVRYVGNREINENRIARWMAARDNRLFWCTSGRGTMLFENATSIAVVPNALIIIPAGIPYCFARDFTNDSVLLSVNFDYVYNPALGQIQVGTVSTNSRALQGILQNSFSDCPFLNIPFCCMADETTQELMHTIQKEYFYQRLHYREMLSALLLSILIRVIRNASTEDVAKSNCASVIDKLIDYIKAHYSEPLTLREISSYMGYHQDYINRLMNQHTGQTIYQYLQAYRINRAAQLIRSTDLPFQEIAEMTGFINASHFSHSFKKQIGKTPREFRKIE